MKNLLKFLLAAVFLFGATPANINTIAKWPADVNGNDALGPPESASRGAE